MKPFSFKNRSLFQQLAISLTITIFLPIIIIGGISYFKGTYQIQNMIRELLDQLAVNLNSQFDSMINEANWLSLQIANKAEVRQFIDSGSKEYYTKYLFKKWGEKEIFLDGMLTRIPIISRVSFIGDNGVSYSFYNDKSGDNNVVLYDQGENVKRAGIFKQNLPPDGSMKIFFNRLKVNSSGLPETSQSETGSPDGNDFYITFARRIFSRLPFVAKGTITIDIRAKSLGRILGKESPKNRLIWVIDDRGQIIYSSDSSKIGVRADRIFNPALLSKVSGSFTKKWEGKKRFYVYHTSLNTGWKIMAEIPVQELNRPVSDLGKVILYTLMFVLPLSLLVGYLFIRSILMPVRTLEQGMKEVGNENWKEIEQEIPENEIGNLMTVYNRMVQKISDLIEKVYKAELERREYRLSRQQAELARQKAEFQALQTQINPHFLYNTLSAINTYALMAEEPTIPEMVEALSQMLRYAVQNPLEPVKIKDEVEHVRNFLIIQNYRNKRMPLIEWNLTGYLDYPILRLTLQPLVENVFQHAFPDGIRPEHRITISAGEAEGFFIVEVMDNGSGINGFKVGEFIAPGNEQIKLGIGLTNVHRRIQMAFGAKYGLMIGRDQNQHTIVKITLPLNETDYEHIIAAEYQLEI